MPLDHDFSADEALLNNIREFFKRTFIEDIGTDPRNTDAHLYFSSTETERDTVKLTLSSNEWTGATEISLSLIDLINFSLGTGTKHPGITAEQKLAIFDDIFNNPANVDIIMELAGKHCRDDAKSRIYNDIVEAKNIYHKIRTEEGLGKKQLKESGPGPAYAIEAERLERLESVVISVIGGPDDSKPKKQNFINDPLLSELTTAQATIAKKEVDAPKPTFLRSVMSFGKLPKTQHVYEDITSSLRDEIGKRHADGVRIIDNYTSELGNLFRLDPGLLLTLRDEGALRLNWRMSTMLEAKINEIKEQGFLASTDVSEGENVGDRTLKCLENLLVAKKALEAHLIHVFKDVKPQTKDTTANELLLIATKKIFNRGNKAPDVVSLATVAANENEGLSPPRRTSAVYLNRNSDANAHKPRRESVVPEILGRPNPVNGA